MLATLRGDRRAHVALARARTRPRRGAGAAAPDPDRRGGGRETLSRVVETQERERRRIAQDLHDRTAGGLTSVLFALRRLERELADDGQRAQLGEAREGVAAAIEDVRDLIADLRPKVLDDFGLGPALERLCETDRAPQRPRGAARARRGLDGLPADVATATYRIVAGGARERRAPRRRDARSTSARRSSTTGWSSRSRTTARASARARSATASRA